MRLSTHRGPFRSHEKPALPRLCCSSSVSRKATFHVAERKVVLLGDPHEITDCLSNLNDPGSRSRPRHVPLRFCECFDYPGDFGRCLTCRRALQLWLVGPSFPRHFSSVIHLAKGI